MKLEKELNEPIFHVNHEFKKVPVDTDEWEVAAMLDNGWRYVGSNEQYLFLSRKKIKVEYSGEKNERDTIETETEGS